MQPVPHEPPAPTVCGMLAHWLGIDAHCNVKLSPSVAVGEVAAGTNPVGLRTPPLAKLDSPASNGSAIEELVSHNAPPVEPATQAVNHPG